ncbi:unnamed protein product [Callosobruchus maculatus]|uniref:DHHA2 domain-containing protein n=1 Tax=Callosobruchus maculatus TaxID=64391 RepID=A0A653DI04_CALMS|nr:unnamed protein product [Callosobruchus maculatus]
MEDFRKYLQHAKDSLVNDSFKDIHIVLGNESCDLDSCICSLALAYYLYKKRHSKIPCSALVVAVQNVSKEHFLFRSDNCFVLQELNIPLESLIYRDSLDLNYFKKSKSLTTTLVDHHVLSSKDDLLKDTVIQIFDHRPIDLTAKWDDSILKKIEQVGSCATIIAEKLLEEDFLFKELAWLLYEVIVYDTVGLLPENGRAKELDISIASRLEEKYGFKEDRKTVYQKLWRAHNDVSHLTPKQLLNKDLKMIETIPVPGLPMLVIDYLKLEDARDSINKFSDELKAPMIVLIGLDATDVVKRDVGIYYKPESTKLKDILLQKLQNSQELKGYDFMFCEVPTSFPNIVYLEQNNVKLTRKQIVPLVLDAIKELKH